MIAPDLNRGLTPAREQPRHARGAQSETHHDPHRPFGRTSGLGGHAQLYLSVVHVVEGSNAGKQPMANLAKTDQVK